MTAFDLLIALFSSTYTKIAGLYINSTEDERCHRYDLFLRDTRWSQLGMTQGQPEFSDCNGI